LEAWFNSTKIDVVVYVSFGSWLSADNLPQSAQSAVTEVLRGLPSNVGIVLKASAAFQLGPVPENIFVSDWLPQQDILGHVKTRLFITQGGFMSLQESLYHGVPLIFLPLFADQGRARRSSISDECSTQNNF
jgi:UDP:flavonoid glycosyltransferase YjiC (YdhE family)